jgi:DNA-binding NarL/FixJ family response regulator
MDHLDALVEAWHKSKEPSFAELLASKCKRCRDNPSASPRKIVDTRSSAAPKRSAAASASPPLQAVSVVKTLDVLSAREIEIVTLLALGYTREQAADMLFLAPNTVKTHKCRIYKKLNVHTATQLGVFAAKAGLV